MHMTIGIASGTSLAYLRSVSYTVPCGDTSLLQVCIHRFIFKFAISVRIVLDVHKLPIACSFSRPLDYTICHWENGFSFIKIEVKGIIALAK
jgi:hypothetical protein